MTTFFRVPENHPQRFELHNEVHARPSMALPLPVKASHLALTMDGEQKESEHRHLAALCERFNITPPKQKADHFTADFSAFQLRWEQHGEFSTYTFYRAELDDEPFAVPALGQVPTDWLEALSGQLIAAIHAAIIPQEDEHLNIEKIATHFSGNTLVGAEVSGGSARAFTDFQVSVDGFSRILILDRHLRSRQAGRLLQRLFEIEVYRLMALLAFPVAKEQIPKLNKTDAYLLNITKAMAEPDRDDSALLDELSSLAVDVENSLSSTDFRFGATAAYYKLVGLRINDLREVRIQGIQTFGEFMKRRLDPAVKTCRSAAGRLSKLSERIGNASQLLRTRVDITLERQNQSLLTSMNRRVRLQLRLQQTVEGLSVIAITNYVASLAGYFAKAAQTLGWPINTDLTVGFSIPIAFLLAAITVRQIRKMAITIPE